MSLVYFSAPHLFPASVVNGRAVGTTFEILYRDEDIQLSDIVEFRVYLPVKFSKVKKNLLKHKLNGKSLKLVFLVAKNLFICFNIGIVVH